MNKTELVETISQRTELSKKDVQSVLDEFESIAGDIVAKGVDTLTIPGFLKFEQTDRKARNPQTGEEIDVPASKAAKVSAGAKLKKRAKNQA